MFTGCTRPDVLKNSVAETIGNFLGKTVVSSTFTATGSISTAL